MSVQPSEEIDLKTYVTRSYGLSHEDADRLITRITTAVIEDYQQRFPPEPARLQPINITFTTEVDMAAILRALRPEGAKG